MKSLISIVTMKCMAWNLFQEEFALYKKNIPSFNFSSSELRETRAPLYQSKHCSLSFSR